MAKKKMERTELEAVFMRHQESILEHVSAEYALMTEAISDGKNATYTYICGHCNEEFTLSLETSSLYSRPDVVCPHCGTRPKFVLSTENKKTGYTVITVIQEGDILYLGSVDITLELDADMKLCLSNFNVSKAGMVNLETKEKVRYESGSTGSTTKSFRTFIGYHYGANYSFINLDEEYWKLILTPVVRGGYYRRDEDYDKFWNIINHIDALKVERISKPKVTIEPMELKEDVPDIALKELCSITYENVEHDLIKKTTTIKACCAHCGQEWLYTMDSDSRSFALNCPYCGVMQEYTYYGSNEKCVAYVTDDDEKAYVRLVSYDFPKMILYPSIKATLQGYYEFNKKGVCTAGWFRDLRFGRTGEWTSSKFDAKLSCVRLDDAKVVLSENGLLQYSGVAEFCSQKPKHASKYSWNSPGVYDSRDLLMFIRQSLKFPVAEKLAKEGFAEEIIASDKSYENPVHIDWNASTTAEAFGISKNLLKYYKNAVKRLGLDISMQSMRDMYSVDPSISGEEIYWCNKHGISLNNLKQVQNACTHLSFSKIISYLERVRLNQMFDPVPASSTWRDYLDACQSIGMDMHDNHVLYPRALKTEHDIVMAKQRFIADESLNEDFLKSVEEYKNLEYHRDNFFIKVPESMESMFEEGRKLKHCCGRYVDDVTEKKAFVLFLRRKVTPDEPFLSIEVSPDMTVRQVRGMNDSYVSAHKDYKEINTFLAHWAKMKHLVLDIR